jgi:hypothetical protein
MTPVDRAIAARVAVCLAAIVVYGVFRARFPTFQDPMQTSLVERPLLLHDLTDGWALSHFLFFAYMAKTFPQRAWTLFLLGVAWEVTEHVLRQTNMMWKIARRSGIADKTVHNVDQWWYARFADIVANAAGIAVGLWLARCK